MVIETKISALSAFPVRSRVQALARHACAAALLTLCLSGQVFLAHADPVSLNKTVSADTHADQEFLLRELEGKVGTLSRRGTPMRCTAYCIAPSQIATAGHCLSAPERQHKKMTRVLNFQLAGGLHLDRLHALSRPQVSVTQVLEYGAPTGLHPPIAAGGDWVFLSLAHPVCKRGGLAHVRSLTPKVPPRNAALYIANVRGGNGQGVTLSVTRCAEIPPDEKTRADFHDPEKLLFHSCPVDAGASGAPIVKRSASGRLSLAGMQVGIYARSLLRRTQTGALQRGPRRPISHIAIQAREIGQKPR